MPYESIAPGRSKRDHTAHTISPTVRMYDSHSTVVGTCRNYYLLLVGLINQRPCAHCFSLEILRKASDAVQGEQAPPNGSPNCKKDDLIIPKVEFFDWERFASVRERTDKTANKNLRDQVATAIENLQKSGDRCAAFSEEKKKAVQREISFVQARKIVMNALITSDKAKLDQIKQHYTAVAGGTTGDPALSFMGMVPPTASFQNTVVISDLDVKSSEYSTLRSREAMQDLQKTLAAQRKSISDMFGACTRCINDLVTAIREFDFGPKTGSKPKGSGRHPKGSKLKVSDTIQVAVGITSFVEEVLRGAATGAINRVQIEMQTDPKGQPFQVCTPFMVSETIQDGSAVGCFITTFGGIFINSTQRKTEKRAIQRMVPGGEAFAVGPCRKNRVTLPSFIIQGRHLAGPTERTQLRVANRSKRRRADGSAQMRFGGGPNTEAR